MKLRVVAVCLTRWCTQVCRRSSNGECKRDSTLRGTRLAEREKGQGKEGKGEGREGHSKRERVSWCKRPLCVVAWAAWSGVYFGGGPVYI